MNRFNPFAIGAVFTAFWMIVTIFVMTILMTVPANAQTSTLGSALNYCRAAFVELNETGSTEKTKAAIASLPEAEQDAIAVVCTAYSAGQKDLLMFLQAPTKKPTSI